ncbi:signal recognition particle-docking protein FtsY [Stappia sp. 28M-7]|uniref:signal recognition particle-docking protein FtsY n=1 Tax=Stappia sp. 28M-7 TaxID=2762596 RepID=UPI00163C3889|nr:signal recognition particle-docking protein FtsY [Stappia sp. 28M-7]MBC2861420.1 signal recognition particle-docking protein FtsY [Stappia sp. 28M-7]
MSEQKRGFLGRLFGGRQAPARPETPETPETTQETTPETSAPETQAPDSGAPQVEPAGHAPASEETAAPETPEAAEVVPAEDRVAEPALTPSEEPGAEATASDVPAAEALADAPAEEPVEAPVEAPVADPLGEPASEDAPRRSWLSRLTAGLSRSSASLTGGISSLFTKRKLDAATLEELEDLLIQADLGVETAMAITERISEGRFNKQISPDEVRRILAEEVTKVLAPVAQPLVLDTDHKPHVVLVVGVNGTGKTTTIGKLSAKLSAEGRKVMLAAGDTFRAAAVEQLKIWGARTGAPVVARDTGADAAGLVFDAMQAARDAGSDVLLIDTAGRLQNRAELMAELEKVVRVIRKHDPSAPHSVLLTLDATTGQNAMNQVEIFGRVAGVTGLVMTKLDGTARGGILVAIAAKHALPVHFIGVGEGIDDLEPFTAEDFASAIAGKHTEH